MRQTRFFQQAELVLQILPFFKYEKVFALKGGTAINFFFRNLPRLSVKQIKPEWELLRLQHIKNLPAVQWKLLNLKKMDRAKHLKAVEKLRSFLEI